MKAFTTFFLAMTISASFAGTDDKTTQDVPVKKHAEKNVKTNGKISTSGCETASGKKLAENDFGYADCVKQIGIKK